MMKIMTKLLSIRISEVVDHKIPEEQFGFRKGRSTLHAINNLISDIDEALRHTRGKFHAVFIDYTKAFDTLNRSLILTKLEDIIGKNNKLTTLIRNILRTNYVQITDGVADSKLIPQTNGVLQGDPISPLLFNIATYDVVREISQGTEDVEIYLYADDMVIGSRSLQEAQKTINQLDKWVKDNKLTINTEKTVKMTFRKGGREAVGDRIYLGSKPLTSINTFKYLSLTMQTSARSYRVHVKSRAAAATKAIFDIKTITRLSLETAMILFNTKIVPIATYGLDIIWEKLSLADLRTLEAVKSRFLKATLGISKHARSRLAYELAKETFFIEDMRMKPGLPSTDAWESLLKERTRKRNEIWLDFYSTEAMTNRKWTDANQDLRHLVNSMAVHGYHHKLCKNERFHDPDETCVCKLCDEQCSRYHVTTCKNRKTSIVKFCENAK